MDNQRLLIWASFGLLLWMTYQAWREDHGMAPPPESTPVSEQSAAPVVDSTPLDSLPPLPAETADAPSITETAPALDQQDNDETAGTGGTIHIRTDVLDLEVNLVGATVTRATLLEYPVAKDQPNVLVELLNPARADLGLIQTGLNSAGDGPKADQTAEFESTATAFNLGDAAELVVPFTWRDDHGISVRKTFRLTRGSYRVDVTQHLINASDGDWRGADYAQIIRRSRDRKRSMFDVDTYSFDGPVVYDGEKSEKLKRKDLLSDGDFTVQAANGWVADIQHHFLNALIPPADAQYVYSVSVRGDISRASLINTPAVIIAPGGEHEFETTLFIGPKLQSQLQAVTKSLKLTVDYGWLTIISQPLFWLLSLIHKAANNWGVAIIVVTVLIKGTFYKLTEASGRSMAKMREIQPRMKALQERYKDDRQALSQAMMELYKRDKVNPAAGCLPIFIQMPFFLAFYWVLLESVEMRQAPFALWITDLSSRDPFFILPIIMGAAMLFQQRLNPTPGDPVQAKVMQVMPIMFTVFFAFFPSGLVLYWVTNTLLSIAQQWHINKVVHAEAAARKGGKKKKDKPKS